MHSYRAGLSALLNFLLLYIFQLIFDNGWTVLKESGVQRFCSTWLCSSQFIRTLFKAYYSSNTIVWRDIEASDPLVVALTTNTGDNKT